MAEGTYWRVHWMQEKKMHTITRWSYCEALELFESHLRLGHTWVLLNRHKPGYATVSVMATPAVMKGE